MAATIIRPGDRRMVPVRSRSSDVERPATEESTIQRQVIAENEPYAHIVEVPAGQLIAAHSHSTAELTVILSGTARIAGVSCEAGSVILVPADENYSIEVGDAPLTMVVMRPRQAEFRWADKGDRRD